MDNCVSLNAFRLSVFEQGCGLKLQIKCFLILCGNYITAGLFGSVASLCHQRVLQDAGSHLVMLQAVGMAEYFLAFRLKVDSVISVSSYSVQTYHTSMCVIQVLRNGCQNSLISQIKVIHEFFTSFVKSV